MSRIHSNFDMKDLNTLGVPSRAECFLDIENLSDLELARKYVRSSQCQLLVIGEGSNLVLGPKLPGLVIKMSLSGIKVVEEDDSQALIEIAAGENWHALVQWCLDQGFYGIENLALIPGAVGAAPVQNIGAYGVELEKVLDHLEYFDMETGKFIELRANECELGYRTSLFKGALKGKAVITRIWLRLNKGYSSDSLKVSYPSLQDYLKQRGLPATPENIFFAVCDIRNSRLPDPKVLPNVGSFFHNPVIQTRQYLKLQKQFSDIPGYPDGGANTKIPAAWLIDYLGLKGNEISGIKISDAHALVLTNPDRLDSNTVLEAASIIQQKVMETFAIQLNIEPRIFPG